MAFTLHAIVGGTTTHLSNGSPFSLLSARGLGGGPVRRVTARGPSQHGDTDLGYRLQPREVELELGFQATTDAILDGYRDTLMSIFKPLSSTPIWLRVTRDDGEGRQLDCYAVGEIKIDLVPEHRPGHYHRATVRLRASDPSYREINAGTVTVTGSASLDTNWQLAGGAIGSAQVLMSGSVPAQGEAWSYAGTIAGTGSWTLALRMGTETLATPGSGLKYAFYVDNSGFNTDFFFGADASQFFGNNQAYGPYVMAAGTNNYFVRYEYDGFWDSAVRQGIDRNTAESSNIPTYTPSDWAGTVLLAGTARRWRSDASNSAASRWSGTIHRYALYSPSLSYQQINALTPFLAGTVGGTIAQTLTVPYEGNLVEYPIISITGPVSSPRLTNTITGDTLDFGTIAIGAGTTYVIDTRYGYKTITAGTVNKRSELTDDSDLATWGLMPAPLAPGGTNTIVAYGSAVGTATRFEVVYYNRYSSF